MKRVAFYAPMKPPDHPTPSGDRRIARLFLDAIGRAGYDAGVASTLRARDGAGDAGAQASLKSQATQEIERIKNDWRTDPPALWFTYHCYYKAPDLIGPAIAIHFDIPYVIAEASRARKRLSGPWAGFAKASEHAIDRADLLLAMTAHDRVALDRDAPAGQKIVDFPPFLDPGPMPSPKQPTPPLRLLTVAMMRGGDKLASYRALTDALGHLSGGEWQLTVIGDGPERDTIAAMLAEYGAQVVFKGSVTDPHELRQHYENADTLLWPGVNEAYGMVYLEAQAAGTPVVAEDWPGPRSVIAPASEIVPQGDRTAFAEAIGRLASTAEAGRHVRAYIIEHHGIDQAAQRLTSLFGDLT